jgi:cbb3-type cytochrome oxidase subunit 3
MTPMDYAQLIYLIILLVCALAYLYFPSREEK